MGASEVLCKKGKRDPPGGRARFPRRADAERLAWVECRYVLALVSNYYYLRPGHRPRAQVIICVGFFFCIMFPPLENGQIAQ